MTSQPNTGSDPAAQDMSPEEIQAVIDRILSKDVPARNPSTPDDAPQGEERAVFGKAQAISRLDEEHSTYDGDQQDLEERRALRRKAGLSTELEDVTEVEYRQLRLERVVLAGTSLERIRSMTAWISSGLMSWAAGSDPVLGWLVMVSFEDSAVPE